MSAWQASLLWIGICWAGWGLARRWPRPAAIAPGLAATAVIGVNQAHWLGPLVAGHAEVLGRESIGLLVLGALALSATCLADRGFRGTVLLPAGPVGAAAILMQSPTGPLEWAELAAVAAAVLGGAWLLQQPSRQVLTAGRIAGLGALALLGAAVFVPAAQPAPTTVNLNAETLVGWLLLLGLAALLALVPLGGWGVAILTRLRPSDAALWFTLLVPAIIVSLQASAAVLVPDSASVLGRGLVWLGLSSAVWSGLQAVRSRPEHRYARLLLGDIGLIAVGLGIYLSSPTSGTSVLAVSGMLVLLLVQICLQPILLGRPELSRRLHSLAWALTSGLPPSATFWGRFLILLGCAAYGSSTLEVGLLACSLLALAAVRGLLHGDPEPGVRGRSWLPSILAVAALVAAVALSVAPMWSGGVIVGRLG